MVPRQGLQQGAPFLPPRATNDTKSVRDQINNLNNNPPNPPVNNNTPPPIPTRNKSSFIKPSPTSSPSSSTSPSPSKPLTSYSSVSYSPKPTLSSYSATSPSSSLQKPAPPPRHNTVVLNSPSSISPPSPSPSPSPSYSNSPSPPPPGPKPSLASKHATLGTRIDPSTIEFSPKPTLQNLNSPPSSSYSAPALSSNSESAVDTRKPYESVSQPLPPKLPARSKAPSITNRPSPSPSYSSPSPPSPSPSYSSSSPSPSPSYSSPPSAPASPPPVREKPPPLPGPKPNKIVASPPSNNNNNFNNFNTASVSSNSDSVETLLNSNSPMTAKVIKGFQKEDFAVYQVDFKWKEFTWTVFRRFRQFADLNDAVGAVLWPDYVLPAKTLLPPKFSESFVEKRREGLDNYLDGCCKKMKILVENDKHKRAWFKFAKPAQLGDLKGANFSNDIFKEL